MNKVEVAQTPATPLQRCLFLRYQRISSDNRLGYYIVKHRAQPWDIFLTFSVKFGFNCLKKYFEETFRQGICLYALEAQAERLLEFWWRIFLFEIWSKVSQPAQLVHFPPGKLFHLSFRPWNSTLRNRRFKIYPAIFLTWNPRSRPEKRFLSMKK